MCNPTLSHLTPPWRIWNCDWPQAAQRSNQRTWKTQRRPKQTQKHHLRPLLFWNLGQKKEERRQGRRSEEEEEGQTRGRRTEEEEDQSGRRGSKEEISTHPSCQNSQWKTPTSRSRLSSPPPRNPPTLCLKSSRCWIRWTLRLSSGFLLPGTRPTWPSCGEERNLWRHQRKR